MKPIYVPSGKAKEYGDYAINIYTGCPHRCYYCFAPSVMHKTREEFHGHVEPRTSIVEAVNKQLDGERITNKLIHLCFTCDPYPREHDSTATREIIKQLKDNGNHVQILTKNGHAAMRDFDLLDCEDWFGITYAGYNGSLLFCPPASEPNAGEIAYRLYALDRAHSLGIKTWCSCEPVLNQFDVIRLIKIADYVDKWKIGKLNYYPSGIDWGFFGQSVEAVCKEYKRDYYIKDGLRKEMEKNAF